jgi:hypothetical protein
MKKLSIGLFTSLTICLIAMVIEAELPLAAETLYSLAGWGMLIFGYWLSIVAYNNDR